jgi:hypothetical protein
MSDRVELPRAERCETCRFWQGHGDGTGNCRRYPPVVYEKDFEVQFFPNTKESWWCGEYQPATVAPPPPAG